jgi:DNA-binding CsgD family transcriptional regulator
LPHAAFRAARRGLDAEASGMVRLIRRRGQPVFGLDPWGRVLRVHGNDAEQCGVLVGNRRLVAADRLAQPQLERAVAVASRPPQQPAVITITNQSGERVFVQIVPVTGGAREVFLATAAIAVIIEASSRPAVTSLFPAQLQEAFGLTIREAQIAALLAEGLSLADIAERLGMGVATARNHLKNIFEKSGARRQGEMIVLLSKLKS